MRFHNRFVIIMLACFFSSTHVSAQVKLPALVRDSMVLQRETPLTIWGWAAKDENITIAFNNKTFNTKANDAGKWFVVLPAMKAGGPYTMDITASNHLHLQDILIGDVWLCSGQSNMVLNMERVKEKYPDEVANADYPEIRNFFIPTVADATKLHDDLPPGNWETATAKSILNIGAASYFFAKWIYQKYHVPIGLINSSVGGTPIEAWISEEGLKDFPGYLKTAARFKDTVFINSMNRRNPAANTFTRPMRPMDKGLGDIKWYDTSYVPNAWHTMMVPGYWADQGIKGLNGAVWFRKEIMVPASMTGIPAKLFVGRIVDADQTYVNGKFVGGITYQYPPRRYELPAGLLKPGKNIIVVRITNTAGKGGFVPDKPYYLTANNERIDLRGDWQYKVGEAYAPPERGFGGGGGGNNISMQNQPTALYNAMIAPFINYSIKGILWYQGEANTGKPEEYQYLLPALIADWRNKWNNTSIPFIYAQLPNFMEVQYLPSESQWATLRDGQLKTLSVNNTGMAVAIDAGEWNDIHPLNKKDVGERLAFAAEKLAYGNNTIVYSGPIYQSAKVEGNKIIVHFSNTGSGLTAKGDNELYYFSIAGADKKFVWAKASIEGNTVVVWNDDIKSPMYVRYAWADNPEGANLYNKEGLPASPFRTDQ